MALKCTPTTRDDHVALATPLVTDYVHFHAEVFCFDAAQEAVVSISTAAGAQAGVELQTVGGEVNLVWGGAAIAAALSAGAALGTGKWHRISGVIKPGFATSATPQNLCAVWVDGVAQTMGFNGAGVAPFTMSGDWCIGGRKGVATRDFNGMLARVYVDTKAVDMVQADADAYIAGTLNVNPIAPPATQFRLVCDERDDRNNASYQSGIGSVAPVSTGGTLGDLAGLASTFPVSELILRATCTSGVTIAAGQVSAWAERTKCGATITGNSGAVTAPLQRAEDSAIVAPATLDRFLTIATCPVVDRRNHTTLAVYRCPAGAGAAGARQGFVNFSGGLMLSVSAIGKWESYNNGNYYHEQWARASKAIVVNRGGPTTIELNSHLGRQTNPFGGGTYGAATNAPSAIFTDGTTLGCFDLYEIFIWQRRLSDAEVAAAIAALCTTWGVVAAPRAQRVVFGSSTGATARATRNRHFSWYESRRYSNDDIINVSANGYRPGSFTAANFQNLWDVDVYTGVRGKQFVTAEGGLLSNERVAGTSVAASNTAFEAFATAIRAAATAVLKVGCSTVRPRQGMTDADMVSLNALVVANANSKWQYISKLHLIPGFVDYGTVFSIVDYSAGGYRCDANALAADMATADEVLGGVDITHPNVPGHEAMGAGQLAGVAIAGGTNGLGPTIENIIAGRRDDLAKRVILFTDDD